MPSVRKILAKTVLSVGTALGAVVGALWLYLMWQTAAAETVQRTAQNAFWIGVFGGMGLWGLIAWPFAAAADYIDPPPPGPLPDAGKDSTKSAHHSRPSRSTASRRSTQR
jgi:4-amino-4-deoxy-L-arabinose transferase-like glycosyltransferase